VLLGPTKEYLSAVVLGPIEVAWALTSGGRGVRPCLVLKIFCKIFHILHHIESCGTYMKH